ncbi:aspartate/glutamate racemase family protein [Bogoriella caseilytica]|uniref:Asp/Glu/hydantoin racemase n=1 Tax=Bogoriella caseilytica TaxID=56055 RepID=A0A3N2BAX0_9MICO|nr:aspartate/glutamate racemase family protein [Bogoriella caseilytica]ROR72411.1 Asp/Glu/hydantoin racemase [Bogoriella caseilytica]
MSTTPRVALLHTGAVVIAPITEKLQSALPGVDAVNYLDDRMVADLGHSERAASVPERVTLMAKAARTAGAEVMMLTCSSISEMAAAASAAAGIPVLRIDEAMADEAVERGKRVTVLATLETTCAPTSRLIAERADRIGRSPEIRRVIIGGAFKAVSTGDRAEHDRLVAQAIQDAAPDSDVIVLAQASMASAADQADTGTPVLTSLGSGVQRLAGFLNR